MDATTGVIINVLDHFVQLELGQPQDDRSYEGTGFEYELIGLGDDWQTVRAKTGVAAGPVEERVAFGAAAPPALADELDHWDIAGEVSAIANGQITAVSVLESIPLPGLEHFGPVRVRCCARGRQGIGTRARGQVKCSRPIHSPSGPNKTLILVRQSQGRSGPSSRTPPM